MSDTRVSRRTFLVAGGAAASSLAPLGLNDWGLQPTLAGFVRFGFTPYEALRTVTALPAEVMGVKDDLGTVERGKLADLCLVRGNPLQDIHDAINVEMVMKNGRLFTADELIEPYADADLNAAARQGGPIERPATMSATAGQPMRQNAHLNHDLDVLAAGGPDEGRFAPECADHTGGGCC